MKKIVHIVLAILLTFTLLGCNQTNKNKSITDEQANKKLAALNDYGLDLFKKIDFLPRISNHIYSEQQSSYSRNGNNTDGFGLPGNVTGEVSDNNFIRPLLELNQPGVIYRMWFTNFGAVPRLAIYIDGASSPSYNLNLVDLTSGEQSPFLKPLVFDSIESSGGFVSYVPIVFKESIRIVGQGDFYYNINYQKYPSNYDLEYDDFDAKMTEVASILNQSGVDPKIYQNDTKLNQTKKLEANQTITLYETSEKQTVTSLAINFNDFDVTKFDRTETKGQGIRISRNGSIKFEMSVNDTQFNQLKFKSVLLDYNQTATMKIDGVTVSNFEVRARRLNGFEWKDSPYFGDIIYNIPQSLTTGKNTIEVTLNVTSQDLTLYDVDTISGSKTIDSFDLSNESERTRKNFTGTQTTPVEHTYEYDPNTLISDETWTQIHESEDIINQVYLKITYKDQTGDAVYAPVSSFFGFGAYGLFETLGLMVGLKEDGTMYSYYPMPFESGIKIELVNQSNYTFNEVDYEVKHENNYFEKGSYGYFKSAYVERLNGTASALKNQEPITFLKTNGEGHIVGITHSMSGSYFGLHSRFYLEGDEQIYIDGSLSHSFHGTGTEDFYNGGWYFKAGVKTNPLFGQSNHNYRDSRDRTVMIRTLITDPIYFRSSIDFKMEHGGLNDRPDADVIASVYYYHKESKTIRTDGFALNNEESLTNHNYVLGPTSSIVTTQSNYYEGIYSKTTTNYNKVANITDYSTFNVHILKQNEGVILRREYLLAPIGQKAKVYVDGQLVGIWQSSFRNSIEMFVRQDDFFIPKEFTNQKEVLNIKIEFMAGSANKWTESFYEIYTIESE